MAETTGTTKKAAAKKSASPSPKSETKTDGGGTTKKRTVLTSEQKIKKLEQELADAKRKDQEKRDKERNDLVEKRDKKQAQIDKLRAEVAEMTTEIERLGPDGEALVHPAGLNDDGSPKVTSEGGHVDEDLADAETDADENFRETYGDPDAPVELDGDGTQ